MGPYVFLSRLMMLSFGAYADVVMKLTDKIQSYSEMAV